MPGKLATRAGAWARGLPERHGGALVLAALVAIVLLALALRVDPVLHPLEVRPNTDSDIYERIARHLYETGGYTISGSESAYDWSPGAPIVYAGVYLLLGDADPAYARALIALAVAATAIVVYLIGRRLAGPLAGLVAALAVAVYPVTIYYTGKLMSEPLATLTLACSVLAFLWAGERPRSGWTWALPGALLGLTAFMRPEYLAIGVVLGLLALARVRHLVGLRRGLVAGAVLVLAVAVVVAPWTIYVSSRVGRFVPISTGGGKALYIGTYLPGNGLHLDVKRELIRQFRGREDLSATELSRTSMTPLLDRVASRYPDLPRDVALQRIGRENAVHYLTREPLAFAGMVLGKVAHLWQGSGAAGRSTYGTIYQYVVLALGLAGLLVLARRRRWEVLVLLALVLGISALGGLLLAGTRRNLALMPLVMALAGVAVAALASARTARRPDGGPSPEPAAAAPEPEKSAA